MIEGTAQGQIGQPPSENEQGSPMQGPPTSIPVDAIQADQLPRERGLKYEDVCRIVGSLYLDSNQRVLSIEEQFEAVTSEYQGQIMYLQGKVQEAEQEITRLRGQNMKLERELEKRNERAGTGLAPQ